MKKYYLFILVIFIVIMSYIFLTNSSKDYSLEYKIDDFKVIENYNKKSKLYSFNVIYKKQEFMFTSDKKYSKSRKLIKSIDFIDNETYYCLRPNGSKLKFEYICYDGVYKDEFVVGLKNYEKVKKVKTVDNVDIFSKEFDYYVWNGYGITELLSGKKYNFLDKEFYDNNLSITIGEYILFVDYEQTHTFDRFYIFDSNKKKIIEWNIKYEIDFDSYFMGFVEDYVYLFDRKNMVQYKLNIKKQKIEISSDNNGALYFDKKWSTKSLKELKYKDYYMNNDYLYDYYLDNDKLYLNVNNHKYNILVSNLKVKDIIYVDNNIVYYLVGEKIYCYQSGKGEYPILKDFEWNFSYKNKIFIF